jgi:hypothetical protein
MTNNNHKLVEFNDNGNLRFYMENEIAKFHKDIPFNALVNFSYPFLTFLH